VQRLLRLILTTPRLFDKTTGIPIAAPDYLLHPTVGAGLRYLIGRTPRVEEVQRLVYGQIASDPETSLAVRPEVIVVGQPDGAVFINIVALRSPAFRVAFGVRIAL
jgi:hypothetical protein